MGKYRMREGKDGILSEYVKKVDLKNGKLFTLSGNIYLIDPGSLIICATWLPLEELRVLEREGIIENISTGDTINLL